MGKVVASPAGQDGALLGTSVLPRSALQHSYLTGGTSGDQAPRLMKTCCEMMLSQQRGEPRARA